MPGRIHKVFTLEEMIPSAGRASCPYRAEKGRTTPGCNAPTTRFPASRQRAERAFVAALDGGCSSPIAAYAQVSGQQVRLTGLYYHEPAGAYLIGSRVDTPERAAQLGEQLAEELKGRFLRGCTQGAVEVNEGGEL